MITDDDDDDDDADNDDAREPIRPSINGTAVEQRIDIVNDLHTTTANLPPHRHQHSDGLAA